MTTIADYLPGMRTSWLRCRALAFLDTCYYDDVKPERPADPQIQLVALDLDQVIGILDITVAGELATMDTIAVHPDHRRAGIADRLLTEGRTRLPATVALLDAWTREDQPALRWYRRNGFSESDHYLHVHRTPDDPKDGFATPAGLRGPLLAFCHAELADEQRIRAAYQRVYVCRRFALQL